MEVPTKPDWVGEREEDQLHTCSRLVENRLAPDYKTRAAFRGRVRVLAKEWIGNTSPELVGLLCEVVEYQAYTGYLVPWLSAAQNRRIARCAEILSDHEVA